MNGFRATRLVEQYAFVDDCPDEFLPRLIALPVGATLEERVAGLLSWRKFLLTGRTPPAQTWPGAPLDVPLRRALDELDLARFCRDQPKLVDTLLADLLDSTDRQYARLESHVLERLRELEALAREEEEKDSKRRRRELTDDDLEAARTLATEEFAAQEHTADGAILTTWGPRARLWAQIDEVFGDLGALLGRGWDLSRGVLHRTGWLEAVRLTELVKQLPELAEVVRSLGRLQHADDGRSIAEEIMGPMLRLDEERREAPTPLIPAETRGITRGGDVSRMLPSEAAMLGHPKLRLLWHARRAERALMTYRVEGVEVETVLVEREVDGPQQRDSPPLVRGPIIAVVDTSGSMNGVPEQVAKALVLEALRTAHAERRRCLLYSFSGPGDLKELELDLSDGGIGSLLDFLAWSFHGGTDIGPVTTRVLERLAEEDWQRADVLLLTDGEFPVAPSLVAQVDAQRELGSRFHGVQIGSAQSDALGAICDELHRFSDWAAALTPSWRDG